MQLSTTTVIRYAVVRREVGRLYRRRAAVVQRWMRRAELVVRMIVFAHVWAAVARSCRVGRGTRVLRNPSP